MKIFSVIFLQFLAVFCLKAGILTLEEIRSAEPPDQPNWEIEKELHLGKGEIFKAIFVFSKKGNGSLSIGGDLWLPVWDRHDDGSEIEDGLLDLRLVDFDEDGYLDLEVSGIRIYIEEGNRKVTHSDRIHGRFRYDPSDKAFHQDGHLLHLYPLRYKRSNK